MTAYRLHRVQTVGGSLAEVFAFFKDPYNLEAITPPWLGFRIVSTTDREVRVGTRIRYRLRLHGIPMNWESRITEYDEGTLFADEQLRGPYASWYHRHRFTEVEGGVLLEDVADYVLPFGPLGRLAHPIVRAQLTKIFDHRRQVISARFPLHAGYRQNATSP